MLCDEQHESEDRDWGRLIRSLLAEAQSDEELASAFRERWIQPRREGVIEILKRAIREGDLRHDIDLETTTDMLYGPIYYRLILGTGAIDTGFTDRVYEQFLAGHRLLSDCASRSPVQGHRHS